MGSRSPTTCSALSIMWASSTRARTRSRKPSTRNCFPLSGRSRSVPPSTKTCSSSWGSRASLPAEAAAPKAPESTAAKESTSAALKSAEGEERSGADYSLDLDKELEALLEVELEDWTSPRTSPALGPASKPAASASTQTRRRSRQPSCRLKLPLRPKQPPQSRRRRAQPAPCAWQLPRYQSLLLCSLASRTARSASPNCSRRQRRRPCKTWLEAASQCAGGRRKAALDFDAALLKMRLKAWGDLATRLPKDAPKKKAGRKAAEGGA